MQFHYENLDATTNGKLCKLYSDGFEYFIRVGSKGWLYPKEILANLESYRNFQTRQGDVWIAGFPRNGTTVTQDLCWLLLNNFDYEKFIDYERQMKTKVQFFERRSVQSPSRGMENMRRNGASEEFIQEFFKQDRECLMNIEKEIGRRVIKSHLPFELAPSNLLTSDCKVIYLARNVKDTVVSYYHLQRMIGFRPFIGQFDEFYDLFENNLVLNSPYWEHVKQGWELKDHPNVLFLFYEDLKKDLAGYIKKIADFINIDLTSMQLAKITNFFEFENYKKINELNKRFDTISPKEELKKGNKFVRNGKVGNWKEYFTKELEQRVNKWIETNMIYIPELTYRNSE